MNYCNFETAFSSARLNRYLMACNGNRRKAMQLYRYNIKLCQKFYGMLNVFEVILRNAIDNHYSAQFANADWIQAHLAAGGMLEHAPQNGKTQTLIAELRANGRYSSDRVVSGVSFGFWPYFFTRRPFRTGGQTLLRALPGRAHGLNQRTVYNELQSIKNFRNRIAHHEAICFNAAGQIDLTTAKENYRLLCNYVAYLGYDVAGLYRGMDVMPDKLIAAIENL